MRVCYVCWKLSLGKSTLEAQHLAKPLPLTTIDCLLPLVQREYAARAAVLQAAADEHLQNGVLAEWQPPIAGMFLWLKLLVVPDADAILSSLKDVGVILVPGILPCQPSTSHAVDFSILNGG